MDFSYNLELMDLILPPHDTVEDVCEKISCAKESDNCDVPVTSTESKTSNKSSSLLIPGSKKTERTGKQVNYLLMSSSNMVATTQKKPGKHGI